MKYASFAFGWGKVQSLMKIYKKIVKCWISYQWYQPPNPTFLYFWEVFDTRWCRDTPPIKLYPKNATEVTRGDGVGYNRIIKNFLVGQNALILRMGENCLTTLNFSVGKSICGTYFKLYNIVVQYFGFTVLIFLW